jgi:hypothetical protein
MIYFCRQFMDETLSANPGQEFVRKFFSVETEIHAMGTWCIFRWRALTRPFVNLRQTKSVSWWKPASVTWG